MKLKTILSVVNRKGGAVGLVLFVAFGVFYLAVHSSLIP